MTDIDTLEQAGLVVRELRRGERAGAPTKVVVARRAYDAAQDDLWQALTDAERLPRWFAPVTGDLRVGGRYQVEGNAGGVVEACDRPDLIALTWEFAGQTSWVEVHLAPAAGGTELTLLHEAHVVPEFWEQYGPGAVGVGWDLSLLGLAMYLASGSAVDPAQVDAWSTSPQGRGFIEHAARGWAAADASDGREEASARAAGERTIGFYTGDTGDTAGEA